MADIMANDEPVQEIVKITDLSVDLLFKIFQYIPPGDLVHKVMMVCRTFSEVAHVPELWRRLMLSFIDTRLDRATRRLFQNHVLPQTKLLRDLTLDVRVEVSQILTSVAENCPKLGYLSLGYCSVRSCQPVRRIVNCCRKLWCLELKHTFGRAQNAFALFTNLQKLIIIGGTWTANDFLERISSNCGRNLSILNFFDVPAFHQANMIPFLKYHGMYLKELKFDATSLGGDTIRKLPMCTSLKNLTIDSGINLVDPDLGVIATLPLLTKIVLRNSHRITGQAWKEFVENLDPTNIDIVNLKMVQNRPTDVLQALYLDRITIFHRARNIILNRSGGITDELVRLILQRNPNVKYLSLKHTLDLHGDFLIVDNPNYAMNLKILDVTGCLMLNSSNLDQFRIDRPEVEVRSGFLDPLY